MRGGGGGRDDRGETAALLSVSVPILVKGRGVRRRRGGGGERAHVCGLVLPPFMSVYGGNLIWAEPSGKRLLTHIPSILSPNVFPRLLSAFDLASFRTQGHSYHVRLGRGWFLLLRRDRSLYSLFLSFLQNLCLELSCPLLPY